MELIILFGTNCAILLANFFMFIIIQKELSYLIRMAELLENLKKD